MRGVVIIGAGPAGLAAARAAAENGAPVTLVDSGGKLGGQYLRQDSRSARERFELPEGVTTLTNATVWALEPIEGGHRVHLRIGAADGPDRSGRRIDTAALVLACGAHDRALPFPGWDLPGVYTAGAAQALAKGQRVAIGDTVMLAGTGPFLFPVARSLLDVGARVAAVAEANDPVRGWSRQPGGILSGSAKLAEAARYAAMLAAHRVPYRPRHTVVAAHGAQRVEAVTLARLDADWNVVPDSQQRDEVDAVAVGFGFTPQLELPVAAGCRLRDGAVVVDAAQATSVPGVFAAGELTGIGGADLAAAEGTVAGTAAAVRLGRSAAAPWRAMRRVRRGRRFAAALDAAYPVRPGWRGWLRDDTLICRCEEVTYAQLRAAVTDRDARAVRTVKLVSRAGLGLCQGRVCGPQVAELSGIPQALDTFARRPIAAPLRLGELAQRESPKEEN